MLEKYVGFQNLAGVIEDRVTNGLGYDLPKQPENRLALHVTMGMLDRQVGQLPPAENQDLDDFISMHNQNPGLWAAIGNISLQGIIEALRGFQREHEERPFIIENTIIEKNISNIAGKKEKIIKSRLLSLSKTA